MTIYALSSFISTYLLRSFLRATAKYFWIIHHLLVAMSYSYLHNFVPIVMEVSNSIVPILTFDLRCTMYNLCFRLAKQELVDKV